MIYELIIETKDLNNLNDILENVEPYHTCEVFMKHYQGSLGQKEHEEDGRSIICIHIKFDTIEEATAFKLKYL